MDSRPAAGEDDGGDEITAPALAAFPRRPIAVRPTLRARLMLAFNGLVGLAFLALVTWFLGLYGPGLVRDARAGLSGMPVPITAVRGACRTMLVFGWCDLELDYRAPDGTAMTRPVGALTLFGFDRDAPPVARVAPDDPGAVSLSWFATEVPSRAVALALFVALAVLLAALVTGGVWASLRELRMWRALARVPRPVAARITDSWIVGNPDWAREVVFLYPLPGGGTAGTRQRLRVLKGAHGVAPEDWAYEEPVRFSSRDDRVLALAGPAGARLVVRGFEPLVLTEEERARLLAATA